MTLATALCGLYLLAGAMFSVGVYYSCHVPEKWTWGSRWRAWTFYAVMTAAWALIVLWPALAFLLEHLGMISKPVRRPAAVRKIESHRL